VRDLNSVPPRAPGRQSCDRLVRPQEGPRGRFASYVLPVLAFLGLAEVENNPRSNRMRAL